ncbi:MAG: hypothetical protein ABSD48_15945, partial [Armatimonadota bacterium]
GVGSCGRPFSWDHAIQARGSGGCTRPAAPGRRRRRGWLPPWMGQGGGTSLPAVVAPPRSMEAGASLHRTQYALGHSDPRTTERYDRARENLADNAADYVARVLGEISGQQS